MKFSLIVPVYNAENTIARCVDSIINQSFSDYELILVNDGSQDKSLELCEGYERKYKNIKVINKENGGASSARNAGLDVAQGDYILFADSDDYVEQNYFKKISGAISSSGLTVFTYKVIKKNRSFIKKVSESLTDDKNDFFTKTRELILSRLINSPCAKIFDSTIIKKYNLRFNEKMPVAEDFNFCLAYIMKCSYVKVINCAIYNYDTTNDESLIQSRKFGLIDVYPIVFDTAFEAVRNSDFSDEQKMSLYRVCDKLHTDSFGTCVMEELKDDTLPSSEVIRRIKQMCEKFYSEYNVTYGYENIVHFAVRTCIRYKLSCILYVLGKLYVKMRSRGLI